MFVDTHCHIGDGEYEVYLNSAINQNVKIVVTASEDLNSSIFNVRMANKFPNVFTCIGVHPSNVVDFQISKISEFKELLDNKKVVAIGEIGLDYYYGKENKEVQIQIFRKFLELAQSYNKPPGCAWCRRNIRVSPRSTRWLPACFLSATPFWL